MYMLINSGPFTLRKFKEHSVATALANNVYDPKKEQDQGQTIVIIKIVNKKVK